MYRCNTQSSYNDPALKEQVNDKYTQKVPYQKYYYSYNQR